MGTNVQVISTGEEVLAGEIEDSNAVWLSRLLAGMGLQPSGRTTVGDRVEDLAEAIGRIAAVADLVFVNGGLGPTQDDLTAQAAADALGRPLALSQQWLDVLHARYQALDREMPESNVKQARLPQGSEILHNPIGSACGFALKVERCWLFFTPGVPTEFKKMVHEQILPHLKLQGLLKQEYKVRRMQLFGFAESRLADVLAEVELPAGISLGYRPHIPVIELKLIARSSDERGLEAMLDQAEQALREPLGESVIARGQHNIASNVLEIMADKSLTLSLAESCTGGMVADQLVAIPGSSKVLVEGIVCYSNASKTHRLGVPPAVLETEGAVSVETVLAMAAGATRSSQTDYAIAISGIAGPAGGSEEKPVGTVAFALATPGQCHAQMLKLPDWGRQIIRKISAAIALDMLRRALEGLPVFFRYDFCKQLEKRSITNDQINTV